MKTLFQSRLQQRIQTQTAGQSPARAPGGYDVEMVLTPAFAASEHVLLLVDANRNLFAMNDVAAQLLGVRPEDARGQPVASLAHGTLAAVALQPGAISATTIFELDGRRPVLARVRSLFYPQHQFLGWVVLLQDMTGGLEQRSEAQREDRLAALHNLQRQIQTLQELITMLPEVGQHHYWRMLLMQHMSKLADEMTAQVQQLVAYTTYSLCN